MTRERGIEERLERAQAIFSGLKDILRMAELDFVAQQRYLASTLEDVLFPLILQNDVIVVSGAFFGDEAKGKMVDAIARHELITTIMRANSGENAGHSVVDKGVKYIFNLAPSCMLVPGKTCLIGPECVMDPINFMEREIGQLVQNNISYDNLYVGNVYITLPHHKLMDFLSKPANASTLQGMSEVHASKVRKNALRLDQIFGSPDEMAKRLRKDMRDYFAMLHILGLEEEQVLERCEEMNKGANKRFPQHVIDYVKAGLMESKVEFLFDLYYRFVRDNPCFPQRADTRRMLRQALKRGEKALIECAQSYPLGNENEKHYKSSTSASTSAAGTIASAGFNAQKYRVVVINVHKLPPSRVGLGENPSSLAAQDFFSSNGIDSLDKLAGQCEDVSDIERIYFNAVQENGIIKPTVYKDSTGSEYLVGEALAIAWAKKFDEQGARTKKPRVLGLFDCVLHYEVNDVQGPYLTISAADRMDECEKIGVVIAYVYHHPDGAVLDSNGTVYTNGQVIKAGDEVPCENVLAYCHPVIKLIDGWKGTPVALGSRNEGDPLPAGLQDVIATIEHFTKAEVISVGNGPGNEGLIYIKRE